jgi:hypothetical protein
MKQPTSSDSAGSAAPDSDLTTRRRKTTAEGYAGRSWDDDIAWVIANAGIVRLLITERSTATSDGCWVWGGSLNHAGYGTTCIRYRTWRAHRLAFVAAKGKPTPGLVIDHLCRNRACVNPAHLEEVTQRENERRGIASAKMTAKYANTDACTRGHSAALHRTTSVRASDGRTIRVCRECRRLAKVARLLAEGGA